MRPYHSLCTLDRRRVIRVVRYVSHQESLHYRSPPRMRGSACVEVMTTLHESVSSHRRHAKGCVPSKGMIAYIRNPSKHIFLFFRATLTLQDELRSFDQDFFHTRGCIRGPSEPFYLQFGSNTPFFGLQLRMLRDRYKFQYQLDHLLSCRLRLFFSLDEFNMFFSLGLASLSLGLAHPLSWLSFARCFATCSLIMIIFLHYTPITGSIPYSLLDT